MTVKPKWKTIIVALLCLTGIMVLIGKSYAAYTNQAYQRGVIRNNDSERVRFASNYLQSCTNTEDSAKYPGKILNYSEGATGDISINLDIYNYVTGNTGLVNERDITYNLRIEFDGATGSSYSVKKDGSPITRNGYVWTTTSTLIGRTPNTDHYILTIPASDLGKVKIIASAVPTNLSVTHNQILAAVIAPALASTLQEFKCSGEFIDSSSGVSPKSYDAFNYEVSISTGKANVTLTWNPAIVEIDQYFLRKYNATASTKSGSLTFVMNQNDGTGDFLIPFYIVSKNEIPDNWSSMTGIVSVTGTQIE